MNNILQTALAEAVNSLAGFFGTTTEAVMEHAPEFLTKHGWYSTLNELPIYILLSVLIAVLICLLGSVISMVYNFEFKHPVLVASSIFIFIVVIVVGVEIVTCAIAPEIVGAHAVLELLKNMK